MISRADLIRRIRLARDDTTKAAAEKALAGEQISDDVTRLRDLDNLISSLQDPSKRNWTAAIAIGLACLVVASLAWTMRISSVNVYASVETDSVTFQLARNWQSRNPWRLGTEPLRLEGLVDISLPPEFAPENRLHERAWLDIDKAQVTLNNLEFSAASKLSVLQASPSTIYLLSVGAPLRGQAQVKGAPSILGGDKGPSQATLSKSLRFEVPATFTFYNDGVGAAPAQLRFTVKEAIVLHDIPIRALSFSREESGAASAPLFTSGISSGTITIGETGEKIALNEAASLSFGPLLGTISALEIGPKSIRLSFQGTSNAVSVGTAGFEQDKVPNLLSYLYHQQHLGFFWGSIVFLWSVLWSTRQLLFK